MAYDMNILLANLHTNAPASMVEVEDTERKLGVKLPKEYVEFLMNTNGGEGFIGNNAYVILWTVDELESLNQAYAVQQYMPGLLLFGSDGGGEAFGFDTRYPQCPIVQVPFIGMAWDVVQPLGATFYEYLERLYKSE